MRFSQITRGQQLLRARHAELEKEAGGLAMAAGAPFRLAGKALTSPFRLAGRTAAEGAKGVMRAGWHAAQRGGKYMGGEGVLGTKILPPVLFGAGAVGVGAAGKAAIGQAREWNRGFDPNLAQASRRQM